MDIQIDADGKTKKVTVAGNMTGEQSKELEGAVTPLVSEADHDVVVDLANVARVDSNGLGIMVSLTCRSNMNKGRLLFARPSMFVDEVLRVTQLNRFLTVSDNLPEV